MRQSPRDVISGQYACQMARVKGDLAKLKFWHQHDGEGESTMSSVFSTLRKHSELATHHHLTATGVGELVVVPSPSSP